MHIPAEWRMDGRVVLITGATAGIGRAGAFALARLGAELVLVGRTLSRVAETGRAVAREVPGARVTTIVADLSSLAAVRDLAARVHDQVPHLHVLINNAATVTAHRTETVDRLETQFAVNHLAPFLLTNLLLDRLRESTPSRVIAVASQVEKHGTIDFADLQGRNDYDSARAYNQSKLANILFTRALAKRVAGTGITPISLHPGVYSTRLLDDLMGWYRLITRLRGRGIPGPEAGGLVLAHAAAAPELGDRPGVHLHEHEIREPSAQACDPELAERLWHESASLTGLVK